MKKIFKLTIVLFLLLIVSNKLSAQIDTLNYVKQFEVNKAKYIGKPFSVLLNDMTGIKPLSNFSFSAFTNKNKRIFTEFNFVEKDLIKNNSINLTIYWADPIPSSDIKYYETKNKCLFTNDEKTFYNTKIIKDIKVYR